jgi:uncharacterized protein (TIGR00730 family)
VRVCVFCGSATGRGERYLAAARTLGGVLADRGIELVYGGARIGTMGVLADAVLAAGGRVTGVIPTGLLAREVAHSGLTDLRVVADMHERKATMAELADAFLVLPGAAGTLDELAEIWTWAQLGMHEKPIGLVDIDGYYQPLLRFVEHMVAEEFLRPEHAGVLAVAEDPVALLDSFAGYRPPSAKFARDAPPAAAAPVAVPELDVLAWVEVRDGRLLTVRSAGKERFYLPGGKREPGESDPTALVREVGEELGVRLDPSTLRCETVLTDTADSFADGRRVRMVCYRAEHTGQPTPGAEIAELLWAGPADIDRLAPAARRILRAVLPR